MIVKVSDRSIAKILKTGNSHSPAERKSKKNGPEIENAVLERKINPPLILLLQGGYL